MLAASAHTPFNWTHSHAGESLPRGSSHLRQSSLPKILTTGRNETVNDDVGAQSGRDTDRKYTVDRYSSYTSRRHPQPFGSGIYTNQLILRQAESKSPVDFQAQKIFSTLRSSSKEAAAGTSSRWSSSASTSPSLTSETQRQRSQEKLRERLCVDERTKSVPKTTIFNPIIENIVSNEEVFVANKLLMSNVLSLKSLHLLKPHDQHVSKFKGIGKLPYVNNDYHLRATNNGFSRQEKGGYFFTK